MLTEPFTSERSVSVSSELFQTENSRVCPPPLNTVFLLSPATATEPPDSIMISAPNSMTPAGIKIVLSPFAIAS